MTKNKEWASDSRDFKICDLDIVGFVLKPLTQDLYPEIQTFSQISNTFFVFLTITETNGYVRTVVHIIMYMACAANVTTPIKAGVFAFHLAADPTILSKKSQLVLFYFFRSCYC